MKTLRAINKKTKDDRELAIMIADEYNTIINKASKIESLYWEIEKDDLTENLLNEVTKLVQSLTNELNKLFTLENDLLFNEVDNNSHKKYAIQNLREENEKIIELCEDAEKIIKNNDLKHPDKNSLQAAIIALSDLIVRNGNKKKKSLLHEVKEILSDEKIDYIKQKLSGKLDFLAV
jgi:hypothetical protein